MAKCDIPAFLSFKEDRELFEQMSYEQIGRLYMAMYEYAFDGTVSTELDDPLVKTVFLIIRRKLDYNSEKYDELSRKRSAAGKKGAEKRWQSDSNDMANDSKAIVCQEVATENDSKNGYILNSKFKQETISNDIVAAEPPKKKNRPNSVTEVSEYRQTLGYKGFEADRFFDYYERNGWVQGRGKPIKDWKAAVRNWQKMRSQYDPPQTVTTSPPPIDKGMKRVVLPPVFASEKVKKEYEDMNK